MISLKVDGFDLLVAQETLRSLLQHHSLKASTLYIGLARKLIQVFFFFNSGFAVKSYRKTFGQPNTYVYDLNTLDFIKEDIEMTTNSL